MRTIPAPEDDHDPSLDVHDDTDPEPAPGPLEVRYVPDPEHPENRRTRNALARWSVAVYLAGIVVWIVLGSLGITTVPVSAALVALGPFVGAIVAWYFPGRDNGRD
ncbi:hypothetical protein AB2L27_00160 [Kineococcus sp. LSe6-4]|uniref:DUF2530 domain-containing protein n=1 Tax=Kineococcus halophytocola TaxID=3234027 RepID=A0ABV4GV46_9ACTN